MMYIPAKYATLSGVTSNLSRLCGLAMMPSSMVRILAVRDTVVGVGCRKPFSKCPTNAKWKLAAEEIQTMDIRIRLLYTTILSVQGLLHKALHYL
jgi:hypothetical protein